MLEMFSQIYGLAISLFVFFGILYLLGVVWAEETQMQAVIKTISPLVLIASALPFLSSLAYLNWWKLAVVLVVFILGFVFSIAAGILQYGKGGAWRIVFCLLVSLFCWGGIIFLFFDSINKLS